MYQRTDQPADARRKEAQEAFRRGALEEAVAMQRSIVYARDVRPRVGDFVVLGMFLYYGKRFPEAVAALREGIEMYPEAPELHENLGVCLITANDWIAGVPALERALALGAKGTNVLDALCNALAHVGRTAEAVPHGRRSLERKAAAFAASKAIRRIPSDGPRPFNPANPRENVISYALWGDKPRYFAPLLENLRIRNHLFPAWTVRVYIDRSVPENIRGKLQQDGAEVILKEQPPGEPPDRRLLWRFAVIAEPGVKRFLVRDADSLLTVKERVAVDDWLRSGKFFHVMRDYYSHTDLILAGLWGGVGGILPETAELLRYFKPWRPERAHIDQDLLAATVWPTLRQSCVIHDSVFTGCLGSVPFPPYGGLPQGHHVGQNAFIHFKSGK